MLEGRWLQAAGWRDRAELVELEPEAKAALWTAFEEDETDGEDLATLPAKPRGRATLLATLLVKQSGMRWR